mmetsp:Transcript_16674/g.36049  ORF Transcript_16674/g.36049 Transcript_16674/m.36049 type:complete len:706 (+) Transcript_16674:334-2451(+)
MAPSTSCHRRTPLSYSIYSNHRHAALLLCAFVVAALHPVVTAQYDTIDGHSCFRNLDGMMQSMFDLANKYPELASINDIGDSYLKSSNSINDDYDLPEGGFDIYAMNITASDSSHQSSAKGKMLIISGVHAREYAPPELAMRFAETLVDGYNVDADITWLLQHTEIHLIIYVNPDGRYVAENYPELMWRKNLNPNQGDGCSSNSTGVDLNRNYDFAWGNTDGASPDPCDNEYHGRSPHSEPETQAVVNYAQDLFPEEQRKDPADINVELGEDIMGIFVDIHASGGYVYFPWGFEDSRSPDDDALQALGRKLAHFNDYKLWAPGSSDFEYPAAGDGSDYMYGVMGVASFGLELGEDFYEDCNLFEDQVAPTNLPALLYASKISKKPFSLVKGPDIIDLVIVPGSEQDGDINVTVVASDSLMVKSHGGSATGDQGVAKVQLYLDVHPDDYNEGDMTWEMLPVEDNSEDPTFELEIIFPNGVSSGRHTLYAQAMDNDDYLGPVSSIFFDMERQETAAPSISPSSAPTHRPTGSPSQAPSVSPTTAEPSENPTTAPTSSPTSALSINPSKAPSNQPTTSPSGAPTTSNPTLQPTTNPTITPSSLPTYVPSTIPSNAPSEQPSTSPSNAPSTSDPSSQPTNAPTIKPSTEPSSSPTLTPAPTLTEQENSFDIDPATSPSTADNASDNASNAACPSVAVIVASALLLLCLA